MGALDDFAEGWRASGEQPTWRPGTIHVVAQGLILPLALGFLVLGEPSLLPHGGDALLVFVGLLLISVTLQVALLRMRAGGDDAPNTQKYAVKLAALGLVLILTFIGTAAGARPSLAVGEVALVLASLTPYARQQAFAVWGIVLALVIYVPFWQNASVGVLRSHAQTPSQAYPDAVRLLVVAGMFATLGALGRKDAEQQAKVAKAVAAERAHIARELHDVVAHQMTVVILQAEGASSVLAADPPRAAEALAVIEGTARDALVELRRTLGVLREGADEHAGQAPLDSARAAPQPTLVALPGLFAQVKEDGLRIEARMNVPDDLSPGTELQVYRIVQEALTNVLRHAGASEVRVDIASIDGSLEIRVEDDGTASSRTVFRGAGLGLRGMRERVDLLGGQLHAGARSEGGWSVVATLPLEKAADA